MKKLAILFALALCVALAGCNQPAPPQGGEPSEPQETPEVDVIITEPEEPTPLTDETDEQTATLYIGTKANGFTGEGGDPDALDIWYYMEGDQPLELPILGLSWPIDQPYQWAGAETE